MLGTGFDSIHNGNRQEWRQFLTHLSSCHCSYCAFSEAVPWEHCMGTDSYNKTLELPLKQDCSHLMLSLHTAPYLSCSFLPQACSPRKEFAFSLLKHLDEFQQGWQPTFWADRLQQNTTPTPLLQWVRQKQEMLPVHNKMLTLLPSQGLQVSKM